MSTQDSQDTSQLEEALFTRKVSTKVFPLLEEGLTRGDKFHPYLIIHVTETTVYLYDYGSNTIASFEVDTGVFLSSLCLKDVNNPNFSYCRLLCVHGQCVYWQIYKQNYVAPQSENYLILFARLSPHFDEKSLPEDKKFAKRLKILIETNDNLLASTSLDTFSPDFTTCFVQRNKYIYKLNLSDYTKNKPKQIQINEKQKETEQKVADPSPKQESAPPKPEPATPQVKSILTFPNVRQLPIPGSLTHICTVSNARTSDISSSSYHYPHKLLCGVEDVLDPVSKNRRLSVQLYSYGNGKRIVSVDITQPRYSSDGTTFQGEGLPQIPVVVNYVRCYQTSQGIVASVQIAWGSREELLLVNFKSRKESLLTKISVYDYGHRWPLFMHDDCMYFLNHDQKIFVRKYCFNTDTISDIQELGYLPRELRQTTPWIVNGKVGGMVCRCNNPKDSFDPLVELVRFGKHKVEDFSMLYEIRGERVIDIITTAENKRIVFSLVHSWKVYPSSYVLGIEYDLEHAKFTKLYATNEQKEVMLPCRETSRIYSMFREPNTDRGMIKEWWPDDTIEVYYLYDKPHVCGVYESGGKVYFVQGLNGIFMLPKRAGKIEKWMGMEKFSGYSLFDISTAKSFFIAVQGKDIYSIGISNKKVKKIFTGTFELANTKKQSDADYLLCIDSKAQLRVLIFTDSQASVQHSITLNYTYPTLIAAGPENRALISVTKKSENSEESTQVLIYLEPRENKEICQFDIKNINSLSQVFFNENEIYMAGNCPTRLIPATHKAEHVGARFVQKYLQSGTKSVENMITLMEHMMYCSELHSFLRYDINVLDHMCEQRLERNIVRALRILGCTPDPYKHLPQTYKHLRYLVETEIKAQVEERSKTKRR
jgi:hypothetical protein